MFLSIYRIPKIRRWCPLFRTTPPYRPENGRDLKFGTSVMVQCLSCVFHSVQMLALLFAGYPLLVLHRHARRILSTSLRSSDFDDVISCRGDQVALAIRAHITLYPENIAATWLMFAVRYKLLVWSIVNTLFGVIFASVSDIFTTIGFSISVHF